MTKLPVKHIWVDYKSITVHGFRPPARKGAILRLGEVQGSGLGYKKTLYPVLSALASRLAISLPMERFPFSISEM